MVLSIMLLRLGFDSISFPYYWQGIAFFMISGSIVILIENKSFRFPFLLFTVLSIPFWTSLGTLIVMGGKDINTIVAPFTFIFALTLLPLILLMFSRLGNRETDNIDPPIIGE